MRTKQKGSLVNTVRLYKASRLQAAGALFLSSILLQAGPLQRQRTRDLSLTP